MDEIGYHTHMAEGFVRDTLSTTFWAGFAAGAGTMLLVVLATLVVWLLVKLIRA